VETKTIKLPASANLLPVLSIFIVPMSVQSSTCGAECGLAGAVGNSKLLLQGLLTLPDSAP